MAVNKLIITIANQKGGVGKTQLVKELAYLYHKAGKKVLVIDSDPQRGITKRTDIDTKGKITLKLVLEGYNLITDAIIHTPYYDIVVGDERLASADGIFKANSDDITALKDSLSDCAYDVIIIDGKPQDGILYDMIYVASDYILIPVDSSPEALDGIARMTKQIKGYNEQGLSNTKIIGTVCCRVKYDFGVPNNSWVDRFNELNYFEEKYGIPTFETKIREHNRCAEAARYKMAVNDLDDKAKVAPEFVQLFDELNQKIQEHNKKGGKK